LAEECGKLNILTFRYLTPVALWAIAQGMLRGKADYNKINFKWLPG
jgi:hypothetical protein